MGFVLSTIALVALFYVLRRIEHWLHQHMFKVGWLVTQNYQTTTILYYTFFLPGVVLHELVYWLAAGMLNVRANQTMKWPDAQEVGELKLNFVQISRTDPYRKAIITAAPLFAGIAVIWIIASNRLSIPLVIATLESGSPDAVANAAILLFNSPDFWLWAYFIFAIGNTMFPINIKDLTPWRYIIGLVLAVSAGLFVVGLGAEIFEAVSPTLANILTALQVSLILVIGVDIVITAVLGTIEAIIERFTGNSATFKNGKMITMTLAEAQEERRKAREKAQKQAQRQQKQAQGLTSVYALAFPIPGAPGQEPITKLEPESTTAETADELEAVAPPSAPEIPATQEAEEDLAARITFSGLSSNTSDEDNDEDPKDDPEYIPDADADTDEGERAAQILFNPSVTPIEATDDSTPEIERGESPSFTQIEAPSETEIAKSDINDEHESKPVAQPPATIRPFESKNDADPDTENRASRDDNQPFKKPTIPEKSDHLTADTASGDDEKTGTTPAQPVRPTRPLRISPFDKSRQENPRPSQPAASSEKETTTPREEAPESTSHQARFDLSARLRALENMTDDSDDADEAELPIAPRTGNLRSRLRAPADKSDEDIEDELPITSSQTFSSLRSRLPQKNDEEASDEDIEAPPKPTRPARRMNITPFGLSSKAAETKDEDDEDESIFRRGRSEARNIFRDLELDAPQQEEEGDPEEAMPKRPQLRTNRLNPPRSTSRFSPRFRPVPKPNAADEVEGDTLQEEPDDDDEIIYEDIEDYIPDDDDHDVYIDYDDD